MSHEEVAKSIHTAFKGIGTDEPRLVREFVGHKNADRQIVKSKYLTLYGKKLEEDVKDETKGHFQDALLDLLVPTDEYDATCIHRAIAGDGTKEHALIQILCSKEANEIKTLRAAYKKLYGKDLDDAIANDVSGNLGRILRSISAGNRDENHGVDQAQAKKEAQELYDAGEGTFGTDESEFIRVLCTRSFPQLSITFDHYKNIGGNDVESIIKKEMTGDLEHAALAIVLSVKSKAAFFAREIREAIQGAGTRDKDLIRILVSRSENDLAQIKEEYKKLYGKSLLEAVKDETSGDLERLLTALIGN